MEVVEVRESPALRDRSASLKSVQAGEGAGAGGSESRSLRDLRAFVKSEHNSGPFFYSSEIALDNCDLKWRSFTVVLKRRRSRAIESECQDSDTSPTFRIVETDLLKAVRILVACSTWTHARFSLSYRWLFSQDDFVRGFEDFMFEVYSLLKSSPSLSCFDIRNARSCYKHLPTLLCENPRLETLIVHPGDIHATNFVVFAKTIALCLSRNSVLKSFTVRISSRDFKLAAESLEILFTPFTTSLPSEANKDLKDLVLHLPEPADADTRCEDAIANLVRCNTTLEKLELRFSELRSRLKDGICKDIGRALEANHTLKEFRCFCDLVGWRELIAPFVPDRSGRQPNTTLATLHLFLSHEVDGRRGQACLHDLDAAILKDLATMLKLNTTLKHVQFTHDCGRVWPNMDNVKRIIPRQVEFGTQEKLRMMMSNALRVNTTLQSLAVGFWQLRRVGTEWQTSYEGPCLMQKPKPSKEYIVNVKIRP